ncbi:ATP-binding protein [Streptomyces sp. NPDC029674]|uniref:ATP-binding protein n=1 Tax=Streptomyces sp. NPDC029674 TaxID=3365297 RepID=UPI00384DFEBE
MPLPHTPAAAPIARTLVRAALTAFPRTEPGLGHDRPRPSPTDRDLAELLTAELVANAVEHTSPHAPLELVLEVLPTSLRVEVHDHDPTPLPGLTGAGSPEHRDPLSERGRGLSLVRELSSSAGCRTTELGKVVWFRLSLAPGSRTRVTRTSSREKEAG